MKCSDCNGSNEDHTAVGDKQTPSPGNLSICAYCGHLGVFNEDLTLRSITEEEMNLIRIGSPETYLKVLGIVNAIKQKALMS